MNTFKQPGSAFATADANWQPVLTLFTRLVQPTDLNLTPKDRWKNY